MGRPLSNIYLSMMVVATFGGCADPHFRATSITPIIPDATMPVVGEDTIDASLPNETVTPLPEIPDLPEIVDMTMPIPQAVTLVRVIHTQYAAATIDVTIQGASLAQSLQYRSSSGYAGVNSGLNNVKIFNGSQTLLEVLVPLIGGEAYSFFVVKSGADTTIVPVEDHRNVDVSKVKLRFYQASPDLPTVDIKSNNKTIFNNRAFGSILDYEAFSDTSYSFVVIQKNNAAQLALYKTIVLEKGKLYTLVATGTMDTGDNIAFGIRVFTDNGDGKTFTDLELN